jgi:hypothetical protein
VKLAGNVLKRLSQKGGKEIAQSALPGSILTGILGGITTGNPLAGLAIGAADFGLSAGAARLMAKSPRLAGKYSGVVSENDLRAAQIAGLPVDANKIKEVYNPSLAQNLAMIGGSVAAPVVLEPALMQRPNVIYNPEAYNAAASPGISDEEMMMELALASSQRGM